MVTKRIRWPPHFAKIQAWSSKGVYVPNLRKIHGVEIAQSYYLKNKFRDKLSLVENVHRIGSKKNDNQRACP